MKKFKKDFEEMVYFLAVGVNKWMETGESFPKEMHIGLLKLMKYALQNGLQVPTNYFDLIQYMQKPFRDWGWQELCGAFGPEQCILESYSGLTSFFEEWVGVFVSTEDQDLQPMLEILNFCRTNELEKEYQFIRIFIIEHPVVTQDELEMGREKVDQTLYSLLRECYEDIPFYESKVWLCPNCGWTLRKRYGDFLCSSAVCSQKADLSNPHEKIEEKGPRRYRLKKGCHRYILIPGMAELALSRALERRGFQVEMYPEVDRFDLRIKKDGNVFDIDVKDYSHPKILADYLKRQKMEHFHENVYIVIPQYRMNSVPGYMERLKHHLKANGFPDLIQRVFSQNKLYRKLREVTG